MHHIEMRDAHACRMKIVGVAEPRDIRRTKFKASRDAGLLK